MTRKVVFRHQGRCYRVDADDIERIINHFQLDKHLNSEMKRSEALGLMYISAYSWMGGRARDMNLFGENDGLSQSQRQLLRPATEKIVEYYRQMGGS